MRPLAPLVLGLGLLVAGATAGAAVLAADDFSGYADGASPASSNRGTGWVRAWSLGQGTEAVVRTGEPAVRLEIGGPDTVRALVRRLARPAGVGGKPVFFRCDFSIEASEAEMNQIFGGWYFADAQGYRTGLAAAVIGVRGGLAARLDEKTTEIQGRLEPGRRHTLVSRLDGWDAATSRFTRVTVWLDPDPARQPGAQIRQGAQQSAGGTGPLEVVYFRIHNLQESRFHLYGIRVADSWGDVCPD